ncbi:30S ribosomal protein S15 [Plasmodium gonderi]|uniref:30S ribosomal protein S15 n=1 Tax=Plasmodium gonderi TaxID=77519 RepID=A0A1Y1JE82_PLAGO|nr:30S ribosomal protein S15 [Plasmodium gonderi]GAW80839.1 30S ribosomal protein S15 [Plasmodium gonderi]
MKTIRTCLAFLLILHVHVQLCTSYCDTFYLDNRINYSSHGKWSPLHKKMYDIINMYRKTSDNNAKLKKGLLYVKKEILNEGEKLPDVNKSMESETQGDFKTSVKNKSKNEKSEIEEILKKSENVIMERSFSFDKRDITIKPELLKDLITQKYRKLFQRHPKDCGSSEIQIIILTFKIFFLTEHMKRNKKDYACLRGLFKCVNKRRKLLIYLGKKNRDVFNKVTDFFKIKKPLLPGTAEYYNKDLKYVHFKNTKRFKNNAERKIKVNTKNRKVQTDKILFGE